MAVALIFLPSAKLKYGGVSSACTPFEITPTTARTATRMQQLGGGPISISQDSTVSVALISTRSSCTDHTLRERVRVPTEFIRKSHFPECCTMTGISCYKFHTGYEWRESQKWSQWSWVALRSVKRGCEGTIIPWFLCFSLSIRRLIIVVVNFQILHFRQEKQEQLWSSSIWNWEEHQCSFISSSSSSSHIVIQFTQNSTI